MYRLAYKSRSVEVEFKIKGIFLIFYQHSQVGCIYMYSYGDTLDYFIGKYCLVMKLKYYKFCILGIHLLLYF